MENSRLPADFMAPGYLLTTLVVFFYEFLGTFILVATINASNGNAPAIGLTLFFLLLLTGPITGGHMNPSVTVGVFLNRVRDANKNGQMGSCVIQAAIMIIAQVCGAAFSMHIYFSIMRTYDDDGILEAKDFPTLHVSLDNW